jgi:hypothetical protein
MIDIAEILLKVELNTKNQIKSNQIYHSTSVPDVKKNMQKLLHSYFASKQSNLNTNTSDSIEKSNHGDSVPESEDNIIKKLLLYNGGKHHRGTNVCV